MTISHSTCSRSRFMALVAATLALASLAGCNSPEREQAIRKQMAEPEIQTVGTFEGCEVKYVNRYYKDSSFYIAHCAGPATTTTGRYDESQGRSTVARQRTSIRVDESKEAYLQRQEAAAHAARQEVLAKLSDDERATLGYPSRALTGATPPAPGK